MSVVLLHDLGSAEAGAPWRAVAPDGWTVPDLPGHGATPAPRHGAYDPMGPMTLARWILAGSSRPSLAIGVGDNAHSALILAAGGGCDAVVVVDGLWGPWRACDESIDDMYATLRALAADTHAVGPPPPSGLDPRTRYGYGVTVSAPFVEQFWGSVDCPVLAVETPRSATPTGERASRLGWFGGPTTMVQLDDAQPARVIAAVTAWTADRGSADPGQR